MQPVLVAVAHGSSDPRAGETAQRLAGLVRAARPGTDVRACFVELTEPRLDDVAASLDRPAVIVPLLLGTGYHIEIDIARAAAASGALVAAALGPDDAVSVVLAARLRQSGWRSGPVVLAAAGSSVAAARAQAFAAGASLSDILGVEVRTAFVAGGTPTVDQAMTELPGAAVAPYLLAPGRFSDVVQAAARAAGRAVSEPLGAHPALAELVLARYDAVLRPAPPG